jgi:hypothetical protein
VCAGSSCDSTGGGVPERLTLFLQRIIAATGTAGLHRGSGLVWPCGLPRTREGVVSLRRGRTRLRARRSSRPRENRGQRRSNHSHGGVPPRAYPDAPHGRKPSRPTAVDAQLVGEHPRTETSTREPRSPSARSRRCGARKAACPSGQATTGCRLRGGDRVGCSSPACGMIAGWACSRAVTRCWWWWTSSLGFWPGRRGSRSGMPLRRGRRWSGWSGWSRWRPGSGSRSW